MNMGHTLYDNPRSTTRSKIGSCPGVLENSEDFSKTGTKFNLSSTCYLSGTIVSLSTEILFAFRKSHAHVFII